MNIAFKGVYQYDPTNKKQATKAKKMMEVVSPSMKIDIEGKPTESYILTGQNRIQFKDIVKKAKKTKKSVQTLLYSYFHTGVMAQDIRDYKLPDVNPKKSLLSSALKNLKKMCS